jgi:hypothetical protein
MVYQRSKSLLAARPFGSDEDQYADDFTWLNHSISPTNISEASILFPVVWITPGETAHTRIVFF